MRTLVLTAALVLSAPAVAQEGQFVIDLEAADYRTSPSSDLVEFAVLYGDRSKEGIYATHARVREGAVIPPHTHPNTLTTWVTSGTAYVGVGEVFDEDALVAYPAGTFFITEAGEPHFIMALDDDFSVLDHGAGPSSTTMIDQAK